MKLIFSLAALASFVAIRKACPYKQCDDVECRTDEDCQLGYICQRNQCLPGCLGDENCAMDEACSSPRACGANARCEPINRRPTCSCLDGYTGNPQIGCRPIGLGCKRGDGCRAGHVRLSRELTADADSDSCSSNKECSSTQECFEDKCQDSCRPGVCGTDAECNAVNHQALCTCPDGYTGDPFDACKKE